MESIWACLYRPSGCLGPDYWTYFAERLVQLAVIQGEARLLDIGTCDGNVLLKAMHKVAARGLGIGIDIDYDDFHTGVAEAVKRGWQQKTAFVQMDANKLGFQSKAFHCVLANFIGLDDCFDLERMEFSSSNKMVSEIKRILVPGGQVGIGSWVEQCDIDWIAEQFKKYLPEYIAGHNQISPCYSKENPDRQRLILQNGGFDNICLYIETADFVSPDFCTWWRQMERAANEYFRHVPDPEIIDRFKNQVFDDLLPVHSPEGIRFSKTVSFAVATKPA